MKKTFTRTKRLFLLGTVSLVLSACAYTEYGNRINQEQLALTRLENKRHSLETEFIILLNNLETHPTDRKLVEEKAKVEKKLHELVYDIDEKRKSFELSVKEWDEKIVQNRIEQEMIDKEIHENGEKDEDVDFNNK